MLFLCRNGRIKRTISGSYQSVQVFGNRVIDGRPGKPEKVYLVWLGGF